jgi:uncharacterized membrane protein
MVPDPEQPSQTRKSDIFLTCLYEIAYATYSSWHGICFYLGVVTLTFGDGGFIRGTPPPTTSADPSAPHWSHLVELLLIPVLIAYLASPIIALILSVTANSRSRRLGLQINQREREVLKLRNHVSDLRHTVKTLIQDREASAANNETDPSAPHALEPLGRTEEPTNEFSAGATPVAVDQPIQSESIAAHEQTEPVDEHLSVEIEDHEDELEILDSSTEILETQSDKMQTPPKLTSERKKPRRSLEEKLGAHLPVWIGAVALSLAGIFLVRHFIDQGLISPELRVGLAMLFGGGMIGLAQWVKGRSQNVAAGLAAAGIAVEYGTILAAVRLYEFAWATPTLGVVGLALVTVAAVGLSLRHGQGVAILGLVGGFVTPALLGAHEIGVSHLFGYLLILEIGLVALSHRQSWWRLSLMTMTCGFLWAGAWSVFMFDSTQTLWVSLYLMGSIGTFIFATIKGSRQLDHSTGSTLVPWISVTFGFTLLGYLLFRSEDFASVEWVFIGLLAGGAILLASLQHRYAGIAILAEIACLGLLSAWQIVEHPGTFATDGDSATFQAIIFSYFCLFAVGSYVALWFTRKSFWAGYATISALAFGLFAQWGLDQSLSLPWWTVYSLIALSFAVLAGPVLATRRSFKEEGDLSLAALWTGVVIFAGLAAIDAWSRVPLTLFLSGEVAVTAWIMWRCRIPQLKTLTAALAGVVLVRLLANPSVLMDYPTSEHWLLNWIPIGYGVPLILFLVTSRLMRRDHADSHAPWYEAGAVGLGFAMVTVLVRHGFHSDATTATPGLAEYATYAITWLIGGVSLWTLADGHQNVMIRRAGRYVIVASGLAMSVGCVLLANPLWADPTLNLVTDENILRHLLYAFALPAALAAGFALYFHRRQEHTLSLWLGSFSGFIFFVAASELIRFGFHPYDMRLAPHGVHLLEWGCYSILWLFGGIATLLSSTHWQKQLLQPVGTTLAVAGMAAALLGAGILDNPLWAHHPIHGIVVFNELIIIFGLPAIASACVAALAHRMKLTDLTNAASMAALLLGFIFLSLEVRQAFAPLYLDGPSPNVAEWYTYSAVWIAYAVGLLTGGVIGRSRLLRYASLAVMLASVCKVFLFDTSHLEDLFRVMSYFGLGVSLLMLAYVYQRFVFTDDSPRIEVSIP